MTDTARYEADEIRTADTTHAHDALVRLLQCGTGGPMDVGSGHWRQGASNPGQHQRRPPSKRGGADCWSERARVDNQMSQQPDQRKTRQRDEGESQQPDPSRAEDNTPPSTQRSAPGPGRDDTEDADAETVVELPLDQVFEILKNSRRRETLQYLRDNGGEATLSDVAEHIAAIENDTTVQAISSTQRKRVYVGLYQCHLPKMDDMGVVDFDKNRGTIKLEPAAEQLYTYIEDDERRDWYKVYLAIAAVGAALFALAFGGVSILTPPVVLAGLLVGVTACGIAQAMEESD